MQAMRDWLDEAQGAADAVPVEIPTTTLVWHAVVTVGEREDWGFGPAGQRYMVPITGGVFWGGPAHTALRGVVRAGGADRQCIRADGVKQLEALYEMQCDDGAVLTVHNRVTIDESLSPRYARSVVQVTAPTQSPWSWLNRRVLVGTLQPLMPAHPAVLVRVFGVA
jgi:hypothetical protein